MCCDSLSPYIRYQFTTTAVVLHGKCTTTTRTLLHPPQTDSFSRGMGYPLCFPMLLTSPGHAENQLTTSKSTKVGCCTYAANSLTMFTAVSCQPQRRLSAVWVTKHNKRWRSTKAPLEALFRSLPPSDGAWPGLLLSGPPWWYWEVGVLLHCPEVARLRLPLSLLGPAEVSVSQTDNAK